ncbi:unnamed protein product [Phytophthora fragariaefolia]|uniref:Unnamed protein product n=1 Tax=Phytophthora fragariaefolia TaxID=1490495 RepID=A0A9W6YIS7_9STRA|nr:unnamed protein product [Phytophthora fragariaefolia]
MPSLDSSAAQRPRNCTNALQYHGASPLYDLATLQSAIRYKRYTDEQRHRILGVAKDGGDWALAADHNGVAYKTAWSWVNQARSTVVWRPVEVQRGGARRVKIMPEHVDHMVKLLEDNCLLTLFDLVGELQVKFGIEVTPQTVRNALDTICYTCQKKHAEPSEMNSPRVKDYVGVELIKLSPYSPMLNLIENVFSVFKSDVKYYLATHRDAILRPPPGVTKAQHRATYMLCAAKHSMRVKVTPELCDSEAAHTLSFHARALDKHDMPVVS